MRPVYNISFAHSTNQIDGVVFSKFINFLQLHSIVLSKSIGDHYNIKKIISNLKYIDYQGKYFLTSVGSHEVCVGWVDVDRMVEDLNLTKIFGKFYEG